MSKQKDIDQYYTDYHPMNVEDRKHLEDEILYQIFKKPREKKKDMPHILPCKPGHTQQADLLFLPNDKGFRYALVVVDVGSRLCDAVPLRFKTAQSVLTAIKKMYDRNILKIPEYRIQVDAGTEFQGAFKKYFLDNGIDVRVAQTNRHRQVALVEARNKQIAVPIFARQAATELVTGKVSKEWISFLPEVIKEINTRFEVKDPMKHANKAEYVCNGNNCNILENGTKVRYMLDYPVHAHNEKKLDSKFRATDIRYSIKPTTISHVVLQRGNPPMYSLKGRKALYTRQQLLLVSENEHLPEKPKKITKK
ncbi:transposase family protein [Clostridium sp.]|uniref:integrase catalytic domain-containing protein n=1 Tax=Clostridium sp. TaxID=1506 RepID=UPI0028482E82|nr:transposase family protein [Clostridium sp.]MDR3597024.1 transposase family protein [Clostridium sp.]